MIVSRAKSLLLVFFIAAILLLCAVLKIAVVDGPEYALQAASQQSSQMKIKTYRGAIFDRQLRPLVDARSYILALTDDKGVKNIEDAVTSGEEYVRFNITKRYDERNLARHIIGYVDGECKGVSGLEQLYDGVLYSDISYTINDFNNVFDQPIPRFGRSVLNPLYENKRNLKLTLDYHIQKIVEQAADGCETNSAIVVLDTDTFDVLASCSRPNFDQNNVEQYLNAGGSELVNRAMAEYDAGSIFKIITAACALENGIALPNDPFWCGGRSNFDGQIFQCHEEEGHGVIPFFDAFAKSCNCCFYDLGILSGKAELERMAKRFGMGRPVLDIPGEAAGSISLSDKTTRSDMANAAIGQGDILITPLQAAKIAAVIACGGYEKEVNLVDAVVDETGVGIASERRTGEQQIVSAETAAQIQEMMRRTVTNGTGWQANSPVVEIAGKTGTAETGWLKDGQPMVHGWFVGYFPYSQPKYAAAVFLEDGKSGAVAAGIFRKIAEEVMALDY